jgi:tetratricopeptide (TPR) repeat protein
LELLAERYRLEGEIGRGGMGTVRRAHDTLLDRQVAIKTLAADALEDEARQHLLDEARAAARLNHPNIVSLFDAGQSDGTAYIVMELVEGRSLHEAQPDSLEGVIDVARQVCQALAHAHAHGIVHRDLKPENVIVTVDGRVKLLDFGLARPIASRLSTEGGISGTVFYLAPELAMGRPVDVRADLYSLGVMLYELSTKRLPFMADDPLAVVTQHLHAPVVPPRTIQPDLPPALERLILALMAKQPEDRPPDALAVERALAEIRQGSASGEVAAGDEVRIDLLARGRLIGRRREVDRLRGLWSEALAGTCVLALVSGEPGVGKTRLAREAVAAARLSGATVLSGGSYEYEATTPYLPFVEALRDWVREEPTQRLQAVVETSAPEIVRMAPEAEEKLGPAPARPPLSPSEERLRLFDSLARAFQRMAVPNGLLIFLDDLHWADSGTLQLLHYLLRHLRHDRVLILVAYREVELDRTHPLAEAIVEWNRERRPVRLALGRLSREESAAMLASLFQAETVSPEFVDAIQRETEGNPFFIEEVVKALIESGVVYREDGRWERKAIEELAIPQSVKEAIGRRLNRLDAATLEVLHAAAVIGKTFPYSVLQDSLGLGDADLLPALDQATAAQLVTPLEDEAYVFTHDKIRETLYDEVNPIRRRRLHQQVGTALERRRGDSPGGAQDLAYHFIAAGDSQRGLEYSLQAAEGARKLYAWDEAIQFLATARECALGLDRPDEVGRLDALIGATYGDKGQFRDAIAAYQRALDATTEPRQRARLKIQLGDMYTMIGDGQALAILTETIAELDPQTQRLELASARAQLARHWHYAAQFTRAIELLDQARPVLEEIGDLHMLTRTLAHYAGAYQHLARFEESNAWADRLIRLGETSGYTFAVAVGHEYLAENAINCGLFERAQEHGQLDRQLGERIGSLDRIGWADFALTWAHWGLGALELAEQTARNGLELADRIGDQRLALLLAATLSQVLADRGNLDEARVLIEGTIVGVDALNQVFHQSVARAAAAYLALRREDFPSALHYLEGALRIYGPTESVGARLVCEGLLGETYLGLGNRQEAERIAGEHLKLAQTAVAFREQVRALRTLSAAAAAGADASKALGLAEQALALHLDRSDPLELGRTMVLRASVRSQLGDSGAARRDLDEALGIFERVGAVPDVQMVRRHQALIEMPE